MICGVRSADISDVRHTLQEWVSGCRCILDCMFGENFRIREDFMHNEAALQRRFRYVCS